eukprot:TRINITY_DN449_c0_g1_i1.p1 TRINITY_DN449_c0_g1~~TRINITY_DN449_c0_g1_i1.p1  ORF type:complete len:348 (-),score=128.34 TRINITY_DN449_c0_g1_i1:98-1141(-)
MTTQNLTTTINAKENIKLKKRKISLEEVKHHNSEESGWLAIDYYVYDVTSFIKKHPGGKQILIEHLGKDATKAFKSDEIHSHSKAAHRMLESYKIGELCKDEDYDDFQEQLNEELEFDKLEEIHLQKYGIDLHKPILLQISKLGNKYLDWINEPIPHSIALFGPAWMEIFTRTKWWVVPLIWLPVIFFLVCNCALTFGLNLITLGWFITGLFGWITFEYFFHRCIYHWVPPPYFLTNVLHFLLHGCHHLIPMDSDRLVAPPLLSGAIVSPGLLLLYVMPLHIWQMFFSGFGIGYICYDLTHYFVHFVQPSSGYAKMIKRNHMKHHYKDHNLNYGVSNPLYDYIFGTI